MNVLRVLVALLLTGAAWASVHFEKPDIPPIVASAYARVSYLPEAISTAEKIRIAYSYERWAGNVEHTVKTQLSLLYYSDLLGIKEFAPIITANFTQESYWDPGARSHLGAIGIPQFMPRYRLTFEDVWRRRGIPIKRDDTDPDYQIQLGVAAFYLKLQPHQDPWLAVERYNGKGPKARKHRREVRLRHKEIFR